MESTNGKQEVTESSAVGDSKKDSCPGAPSGDPGQDPVQPKAGGVRLIGESHLVSGSTVSEDLECLTEKVGTLDLQIERTNRSCAIKKRARKARRSGAPEGDSGGGQPQAALSEQPLNLTKPSTSRASQRQGSASMEQKIPEDKTHPPGPGLAAAGGKLRGPNLPGNLAMPGSLRRASGWPLWAKITREYSSPRRIS
jgi:hypothetical protein